LLTSSVLVVSSRPCSSSDSSRLRLGFLILLGCPFFGIFSVTFRILLGFFSVASSSRFDFCWLRVFVCLVCFLSGVCPTCLAKSYQDPWSPQEFSSTMSTPSCLASRPSSLNTQLSSGQMTTIQ
ncbi:uncharacterized protein V1513DRAFT_442576, partial [Lipomyces chichibuensis]|uniref:uncharacterized protein n=1 Tax=Lipomyces chichibuensis TaxID=1546026 RepID=UPI003343C824